MIAVGVGIMLYYRVCHLFFTRQANYIHFFNIGIYDSRKCAEDAIELLKSREGFRLRPKKFYIVPVLRLKKPRLLNRTYWTEGFIPYSYK